MNKTEFMDWLGEIEQAVPVAEWTLGGMRVWPIVRLDLFAQNFNVAITDASLSGGWRSSVRTVLRGMGAWAAASARDWRRSQSPSTRGDAVFLAYSTGVQPVVERRHFNPLLAPYAELLAREGRRVVVWEMCPYGYYNVPRYTPSHFVQPYLLGLRMACRLRVPTLPAQLPGFADLVARASGAGLRTRYTTPAALTADAYFVRRLATGFRRWLERIRPTHGFIADYGLRESAFCLACREAGVLSIDIQHGVQGELHPAYARWTALPPGGYALRPRVFWNRDAASADVIEAWARGGASGHRAVVGGDAWRDLWLDPAWAPAHAVGAELEAERAALGGDAHLLVTLDSNGPLIPEPVLEAMRRAPTGWRFWVRLHPVNQPARSGPVASLLREAGVHHADLDLAARVPLHPLLCRLDAHLAATWSTVVVEAEELGVPSIAWHPTAAELFGAQLASGTLRMGCDADELVAAMAAQLAAGRRPPLVSPDTAVAADVLRRLLALRETDAA